MRKREGGKGGGERIPSSVEFQNERMKNGEYDVKNLSNFQDQCRFFEGMPVEE